MVTVHYPHVDFETHPMRDTHEGDMRVWFVEIGVGHHVALVDHLVMAQAV